MRPGGRIHLYLQWAWEFVRGSVPQSGGVLVVCPQHDWLIQPQQRLGLGLP